MFFLRLGTVKKLNERSTSGFYFTRVMVALVNVGFLRALIENSSVNLTAFATGESLDVDILRTLCDYLYELRILDRTGDDYSLSQDGRLMNEFLLGAFQVIYAYEEVFYNLEGLLKKQKKYGMDVNRRGEFVARGSGTVGKLLAFPVMADLIREHQYQRVLDLGCGDATFLMDLFERNPQLAGYGFDLSPDAIEAGNKNLAEKNLEQKITLFVGDMFNIDEVAQQLPQIDAATCVYVLHELVRINRQATVQMLRKFRESFPGVPLLICEVIYHTPEALREKPGGVMEIQLFHGLSNQQLFSREEWHTLFKEAGFTNIHEDYLAQVRTAFFIIS